MNNSMSNGQFFERNTVPKFTQEEIDYLDIPTFIIKNLN